MIKKVSELNTQVSKYYYQFNRYQLQLITLAFRLRLGTIFFFKLSNLKTETYLYEIISWGNPPRP